MSKCGTTEDHCCWLFGEVCQYLRRAPQGSEYKWRCSLREQVNSWDDVYQMQEYQTNVQPKLDAMGYGDIGCGDWPPPGTVCHDCGENK